MNPDSNRPSKRWLVLVRAPVLHAQRTLGAGILVILPIAITIVVLNFFFELLDPVLDPAMDLVPGPEIPGMGVIALLLLVYFVGLITAHVLGRRVISIGHRVMEVIPVVKEIYGTTRTAVEMLSSTNGRRYSGVVLIEFPRTGIRSIGLVTSRMRGLDGEELLAVYVPTTPIPSSGFLVVVPSTDVTPTNMTVDEAMKVVISGGILAKQIFARFGVTVQETERSNQ